MHYTWHHIHTLWQQSLVFMTSHALYSWHHMHYIWQVIYSVWYHIPCMCDIAQCIYDITPSIFITSYPIYMILRLLLSWQHSDYTWHLTHYIWPHIHCICVITPTLLMISQPIYVYIISSIHVTSYPLYLWHHTHYVWHHNPACWLHHTRHMYDIICTTDDITSTLSHQTTVFMMSHPF